MRLLLMVEGRLSRPIRATINVDIGQRSIQAIFSREDTYVQRIK